MHPALHPDNLRRLPPPMRLVANAAISVDRAPADLRRVEKYLATATQAQAKWMLPVFYINLDTAELPDLDGFDMEAAPLNTVSAVSRALIALYSVFAIKSVDTAGPDLWVRVWPWARFLHFYRAQLPGMTPLNESDFCLSFLSFAGRRSEDPETSALIMATPWFWYMLAQAWIHLPTAIGLLGRMQACNDIGCFVVEEQVANPANMAQLVEGAGGTLSDLAGLVVSFIDDIVPGNDAGMDQMRINFLGNMFEFLGLVDPALQDPMRATGVLGPFGQALLARDIVPAVLKAVCSLSNSSATPALTALHSCFDLLASLFLSSDGYAKLPEAIDEGLLRALVISAQCPFADGVDQKYYKLHFTLLLPFSLVYHRFVSTLLTALDEITELICTPTFQQCAIYDTWKEFLSLALARLEVLAAFDSERASRNVKACDNLQCSKIDAKTAFRRCSGCQCFYYCSPLCQTTDWRHGGHREACMSYGKLLLSAKNDADSNARQRSFLRALVQHDYDKARGRLLYQQTLFMNAYPDKAFLTIHDYTDDLPKLETRSGTIFDEVEGFTGIEWNSILSRAAASGGKMGIHVAAIYDPHGTRRFVIPLRAQSSRVHDRQQQLAAETWDKKFVSDELCALLNSCEDADVTEVH
ncbi:MYND-type domain-containing protein [Mycena sanguinolenta]|uniref:MYND-type domain-containing protein n=1 Tax=Mycena sanguinolenta TaxID=230812 RepID=A0A8H6Y1T4_9AGAR|nr:MYND-type domain-containing protein [Mycena sanguinolenta]